MSGIGPLQPMIWTLIVAALVVVSRWIIRRPASSRLDTSHADKMTNAADKMWETGNCPVCGCHNLSHTDNCALRIWLGGDR
jgi:hypothetical protein